MQGQQKNTQGQQERPVAKIKGPMAKYSGRSAKLTGVIYKETPMQSGPNGRRWSRPKGTRQCYALPSWACVLRSPALYRVLIIHSESDWFSSSLTCKTKVFTGGFAFPAGTLKQVMACLLTFSGPNPMALCKDAFDARHQFGVRHTGSEVQVDWYLD